MQLTIWREGNEQPIWSIVANNPPQEFSLAVDEPPPETGRQLLELMFRHEVARMASGEGSIAVRRLRYGDVPPGFRQQRPFEGCPDPLTAGDYFVSVAGEYMGTARFSIEPESSVA